MPEIENATILIVATIGAEQSELEVPRKRLTKAGARVMLATPDGGSIRCWRDGDWGDEALANLRIDQASVEDFDALVLPGGQINPDLLRVDETALALIRGFVESGKTVAAICHAPWLLIETGAVKGREATSYKSLRTDMENAGALWRDAPVVVSDAIITARHPGDLDAFVGKIIEEVEEGRHERRATA